MREGGFQNAGQEVLDEDHILKSVDVRTEWNRDLVHLDQAEHVRKDRSLHC